MRNRFDVVGLTTAACVWVVGTIGIALGFGFYSAAIFGGLLTFFVVHMLIDIEIKFKPKQNNFSIYAEFINARDIDDTIAELRSHGLVISNIVFEKVKTNLNNGVAITANIKIKCDETIDEVMKNINDDENVSFAVVTTTYE